MQCSKCGSELASEWLVCPFCGRAVNYTPQRKKRGNGQGSVYKLPNGRYKAIVTIGYWMDDDGRLHKKTTSKVFAKKSDAIASLTTLKTMRKAPKENISFKDLYDRWLPTHRAGKSTIQCYTAAMRYFMPLYALPVADIDVDDLQECIDECPHGKRTKENMRAAVGLMYKYGIPRRLIPDRMNLAQFLTIDGDSAAHRDAFTDVQIEKIKRACGDVPQAELIYIMIYLGFRPSEFLSIHVSDIDLDRWTIIGGAKTEAGKGRVVTISPKIYPYLKRIMPSDGFFVGGKERPMRLDTFTEDVFYPTLEAIGIDNPMVEVGGGKMRHKYTPHTCRHTFATLMKRVEGSDKDKQELIGHASSEMLRYYQDVDLADLRKITDKI